MTALLNPNAEKWLDLIKTFHGDPSKYGLPKQVFQLPSPDIKIQDLLRLSRTTMDKITPRSTNPYKVIREEIPFWMIFTLSKNQAILYFSVWDQVMEEKDRALYQDIQYSFQELIQNFIREELGLIRLVRPFRKKTGASFVLESQEDEKKDLGDITQNLKKYSSPQKVLHQVAYFVSDKTIQSGIAYILLLERFSSLIAKTRKIEDVEKVVHKFQLELDRLESVDFQRKIPVSRKLKKKSVKNVVEVEEIPESKEIVFEKVELQEYDGYVEIAAFSEDEDRNFRIYNCREEDDLREEMFKNRKYPLRMLVSQILEDRYSRPFKEYKLKYGVEIEVLPPNWTL